MHRHPLRLLLLVGLLLAASAEAALAQRAASFPWLDPSGVEGAVLIVSDAAPEASVLAVFNELAGDGKSRVATIARASDSDEGDRQTLPGAVITRGPLDAAARERLLRSLGQSPGSFGLVLAPNAAVAVIGRDLRVLGESSVTVVLAASAGRPLRELLLTSGARSDLTMLRRAASERALGSFPSTAPAAPRVPRGSLLIHGGGELPAEIGQRFIELAGGLDAPLVVLPIAGEGTLPDDTSRDTRVLTRFGATNVKSLRGRLRSEVESSEFAAALQAAKGVWFSGGRQWRFVDAYLGTRAEQLLHDVLERGGVIGGSSAGASIQGEYMPRGSPLGNTEMMTEGYERGLGFLPGVAIDQHFTQRRRHADMTSLMRRYPRFLGIGLDEGTCIVVQGSYATVLGRGRVHFYDYRSGPPAGDTDYRAVAAGRIFDLVERNVRE